ncbi:hypothetical protein [Cupriavidus sp. MP-37]|uniref:hypothetical protein n=1 Tax=Cupriavidus sp. MP-37 TaxID=2884455 RepID=UPI001D0B0F5C|nr:hypothetical protein [Cupriavidus sp. MP-37]UDM50914.1 hypothetical protein LIN44_03755 [Cupriavidus sp. MP-37]
MTALGNHEAIRASARPVILRNVYKDLISTDPCTSIAAPLENVRPKPAMPKNRFPGDSSTLAYM